MNISMIWIDFTLIGFVFIFLVIGLLRGFNKEIFSLGFWVLASWVGLTFSRDFSSFLISSINHPNIRILVSFVALIAITLGLGRIIGFLLSAVAKETQLSFLERFGGMFFGMIRGMVVVTVVVFLVGFTPLPKDTWWKESTVIPPFQLLAIWLRGHLALSIADNYSLSGMLSLISTK